MSDTVVVITDDMGMVETHSFDTYEEAFEFVVEYHGVEEYRDEKVKEGLTEDELEDAIFTHIAQGIRDNEILSGGFEIC